MGDASMCAGSAYRRVPDDRWFDTSDIAGGTQGSEARDTLLWRWRTNAANVKIEQNQ